MAVSIGLFVSLFVSITLLPVLYRLFHSKDTNKTSRISTFLAKTNTLDYAALYEKGFRWVMRKQRISWGISVLFLILAIVLFNALPKTQMPAFTSTETLLKIDWNEPINVEENKRRVLALINPIQENLINQTALVGTQQFLLDKNAEAKTSETTLYLQFKNENELQAITSELNTLITKQYPESIHTYDKVDNIFSLIFSSKEAPLVARLRNVENLGSAQNNELKNIWYQIQQHAGVSELKPIALQEHLQLVVDQEKLITYNISSNTLFNTLKSAFNEREIVFF